MRQILLFAALLMWLFLGVMLIRLDEHLAGLICIGISMIFLSACAIVDKLNDIEKESAAREQRFLNLLSKLS